MVTGFSPAVDAASLLIDNFSGNTNGAETDVLVNQTADNTTPATATMTNLGSSNAIGDRTISVVGLGGSSDVTGSTQMLTTNAGDDLNFINTPTNGAMAATRHQSIWTVASGNEDVMTAVGATSPLDLRVELYIGDDTNFGTLPSQGFQLTLRDGANVTATFSGVLFATDPLPATNSDPSFLLTLTPNVILSGFNGSDVQEIVFNAVLNGDTVSSFYEIDELRITAVPEPSAMFLGALGATLLGTRRKRRQ